MSKKEKKVKKSKAVVIWAVVSALLVSVLGMGNVLAYGELSGLADTLFGGRRPIYNNDVVSMYPLRRRASFC